MNRATTALQCASLLLGTGLGLALAASCAGQSECNCPTPRAVLSGEFKAVSLDVAGTVPPEFQNMTARKVRIDSDTVTVEYEILGQPGSAAFGIATKRDL